MERKVVGAAVVGLAAGLGIAAAVVAMTGDDGDDTAAVPPTTEFDVTANDVVVFLEQDITDDQRSQVEEEIVEHPAVMGSRYMDREATMAEYRDIFARNPDMLAAAEETPELVPLSFRVEVVERGSPEARDLVDDMEGLAGVLEVEASPLLPSGAG